MRRFKCAASLDFAQRREQFGCLDRFDRPVAKSWEEQCLESPLRFLECRRTQLMFLKGKPFTRNCLERIRPRCFLGLPFGTGINAVGDELARLFASITREFERHIRIDAECEKLLSAVDPILEAPAAGP
jgi:hypothetical protein